MLSKEYRELAEALRDEYANKYEPHCEREIFDEGFEQAVSIVLDHIAKNDAIFDERTFREVAGVNS